MASFIHTNPSYRPVTGGNYRGYVPYTPEEYTLPKEGFFSRLLYRVSRYGMDFDNDIIENSKAVGYYEPLEYGEDDDVVLEEKAVHELQMRKSLASRDVSYQSRREIMRRFIEKPEIADVLDKLTDDCVVYTDDQNYFALPVELDPSTFNDTVCESLLVTFKRIYNVFNFNDGTTPSNLLKTLLGEGYLALEIIFNDTHELIVGYKQLDPTTIDFSVDPRTKERVWIQFRGQGIHQRVLLDTQVIYISYSNLVNSHYSSYVERLIRPFNLMRTMEDTYVAYEVTHSATHRKFTIDTSGKSVIKGNEAVGKAISAYKERLHVDGGTGEVTVNGSAEIPYMKDYWFRKNTQGVSDMQIMDQAGKNIKEMPVLNYFTEKFREATGLPEGRFRGSNKDRIFTADGEITRDEYDFSIMVQKFRNLFQEVLIKPLYVQMILLHPQLANDNNFRNHIRVRFTEHNIFKEAKRFKNLSARVEMTTKLASLSLPDDSPFAKEFLLKNFLGLTEDEYLENARMMAAQRAKLAAGQAPESGSGEGGGMSDFGGGSMDFGGDDFGGDLGGDTGGGDLGGDLGGDMSDPSPISDEPISDKEGPDTTFGAPPSDN